MSDTDTAFIHWKSIEVDKLRAEVAELKAKLAVFEKPQKWDDVWEKYCQLENIDPDNASGLMEIGASFIYTAGFTEGTANRWISVEDELPIYGECVNLFSNGVIQDQKWYLDSPPAGDDNPILWWANDEFEPNDWVALRPSDLWLIPPPPEAKQ